MIPGIPIINCHIATYRFLVFVEGGIGLSFRLRIVYPKLLATNKPLGSNREIFPRCVHNSIPIAGDSPHIVVFGEGGIELSNRSFIV